MSVDLIGDLGKPDKLAAALQPLVDKAIAEAGDQLAQKVAPAIAEKLKETLDGLVVKVTIEVSRKP